MRIGSKVVCIDDSLKEGLNMEEFHRDFNQWVKKGEEYTIRSIDDNDGLVVSVLLEEIKNPIRFFKTIGRFKESSFKIDRFREIEEAVVSKSETLKLRTNVDRRTKQPFCQTRVIGWRSPSACCL